MGGESEPSAELRIRCPPQAIILADPGAALSSDDGQPDPPRVFPILRTAGEASELLIPPIPPRCPTVQVLDGVELDKRESCLEEIEGLEIEEYASHGSILLISP